MDPLPSPSELAPLIHAAGLPGGGLLQVKTPETAAAVLAPKVQGALALEPLLAQPGLDFVLLCSSITALSGGGSEKVRPLPSPVFVPGKGDSSS